MMVLPLLVLAFASAVAGTAAAATTNLPVVINTWPFSAATEAAWSSIAVQKTSAVDAVVAGCTRCEQLQCDTTVGFGGSPDENGETTLDAMIMDGTAMNVGAVGNLRFIKNAIGVAKYVLYNTDHSILAGNQATDFAIQMGFEAESLSTNQSRAMWESWRTANCQPNYRMNVSPDSAKSCGPYKPNASPSKKLIGEESKSTTFDNHDTIAMVIVDTEGNVVSGTSTNGASHKVPGRVGDGPLVGAGSYADSDVGGCGATGDGDLMMRFLPCYQAVESMRNGMSPQEAANSALMRIGKKFPTFHGGLVVISKDGSYGAAGWGWNFTYTIRTPTMTSATVFSVAPLGPS
eukprot:TRINITY_DN5007_c0_g1_i1.p1 TRINITY_DN5007_c0_g1~~TRINITY_DN5007_c0_g1_i1.p1  ORF type:complete len:347 (-),score=94.67 TRINITY_DN5007_c0_g1_i1:73-1113(-)